MFYGSKEKYLRQAVLVIAVSFGLALLLGAPRALAQAEVRVYPAQAETRGTAVTVDIMADGVTNLYGAEFRVKYDPAVLAVEDAVKDQDGIQITPGPLLPAEQGFVVANTVNSGDGTITFALTLLRPAAPVNGSGPLARITFNRLKDGPATINVEHAKLVAVNPQEPGALPQTLASTTAAVTLGENASPETNPAALPADAPPADPGSGFPWWMVAAVILVLGVIALAGFAAMGGLRKFQPLAPVPALPGDQPAERPERSRPGAGRPSAFKEQSLLAGGTPKTRR